MPDYPSLSSRLHGLYAITDEDLVPDNRFAEVCEQALLGGAGIIQYRDKSSNQDKRKQQAATLRALCDQHNALLIINDDIELAKTVKADGVHLGEDDALIPQARKQLGEQAVIGASCYNRLELAIEAENAGANYVAFGAVYSSPTKPGARVATLNLIEQAKSSLQIPICAIGGIETSNAEPVIEAGADMLAIISGVFAQDDVKQASTEIARLFKR